MDQGDADLIRQLMRSLALIVYLSAALQGMVLAVVILRRARHDPAERSLLGILILVFSLSLAEFAAYWTPFYVRFPHLLFATAALPLLFGPLVVGIVRQALGLSVLITKRSLLHLVPFGLLLVRLIPFYLADAGYKREFYLTAIYTTDPVWTPTAYLSAATPLVHLGLYLAVAWLVYREYSGAKQGGNGATQIMVLRFLIAWTLILLLRSLNLAEIIFFGYRYIATIDHLLLLFSALVIYVTAYAFLGSGYDRLFGKGRFPGRKYSKSTLSKQAMAALIQDAHILMIDYKLYLDPELTPDKMAARLSVSKNHLSQSLNQELGQSFNDFVNHFRIEELKDWILDPAKANLSLYGLALDASFRTKATFNTSFKKATGLSPSAYREHALK